MNKIDLDYQELLKDILKNGTKKEDRTGTGTISVFGRTIRHDMKTGFPLLTTKRIKFGLIVTELLWFLRGDTNIKYLVDNNCHIWDGDAYKNYLKNFVPPVCPPNLDVQPNFYEPMSKEMFIKSIQEKGTRGDEFANKFGNLGPIYGKQWRSWETDDNDAPRYEHYKKNIDQIANLIHDLKTNPDSRRLLVSSWNCSDLDQMVLPPCHYGFQVYTRELSEKERIKLAGYEDVGGIGQNIIRETVDMDNSIPRRAISLMWNQRSVDTFLGLPFNIASYGLLLEIIAKSVNMVPDELIGNLGDVHLYSNHIEQAKEQIGRELTLEERTEYKMKRDNISRTFASYTHQMLDNSNVPTRTREPFPLPTLNINTEFWPTEGGECGEGPLDAVAVFNSFKDDNFCKCLLEEDIQLSNYQSYPTIKAQLSN